jgi:hypothetical protein
LAGIEVAFVFGFVCAKSQTRSERIRLDCLVKVYVHAMTFGGMARGTFLTVFLFDPPPGTDVDVLSAVRPRFPDLDY